MKITQTVHINTTSGVSSRSNHFVTKEEADEIRQFLKTHTVNEAVSHFGRSPITIYKIKNGEYWFYKNNQPTQTTEVLTTPTPLRTPVETEYDVEKILENIIRNAIHHEDQAKKLRKIASALMDLKELKIPLDADIYSKYAVN